MIFGLIYLVKKYRSSYAPTSPSGISISFSFSLLSLRRFLPKDTDSSHNLESFEIQNSDKLTKKTFRLVSILVCFQTNKNEKLIYQKL